MQKTARVIGRSWRRFAASCALSGGLARRRKKSTTRSRVSLANKPMPLCFFNGGEDTGISKTVRTTCVTSRSAKTPAAFGRATLLRTWRLSETQSFPYFAREEKLISPPPLEKPHGILNVFGKSSAYSKSERPWPGTPLDRRNPKHLVPY